MTKGKKQALIQEFLYHVGQSDMGCPERDICLTERIRNMKKSVCREVDTVFMCRNLIVSSVFFHH